MDRFDCFNIEVFDAFIDIFAAKYVARRSHINEEVLENAEKLNCGLDTKGRLIHVPQGWKIFDRQQPGRTSGPTIYGVAKSYTILWK